ncbi:MAG: WbqC family protein [Accumulibacter sp.]|jgi:hypothetical protein|uniref:WbqC family protein n=1 Tax=Accumulibacter sp. TaxID=2053492 RepID=UPI002FC39C60
MQPYFLPYIGYFQLMSAVNVFVIYDEIKYTKKGWINRNRFLRNGADEVFTLPLKKGSDSLQIVERHLAEEFDGRKLLAQFSGAYRHAPCFDSTFDVLQTIVLHPERNLFGYLHHSLSVLAAQLDIGAEIRASSSIDFDSQLKAQEKVLAICEACGASEYINSIGGTELYSREAFAARGIELRFLRPHPLEYAQSGKPFVPCLSIVDVLMFNPASRVASSMLSAYDLI